MPIVTLNTQKYIIVPTKRDGMTQHVHRYYIDQFGTAFRTQGVQQQEQLTSFSSKGFGPFTGGVGFDHIAAQDANDPAKYRKWRDAQGLETRFPGGCWIGPLNVATTARPASSYLVGRAHFKGNFYGLWFQTNDAAAATLIQSFRIATTAWTNAQTVIQENLVDDGIRAFDLQAPFANLLAAMAYVFPTDATRRYFVVRSTDGVTWTRSGAIGAANILTDATLKSTTIPTDGALIAPTVIGGEEILAIWDEVNGEVEFYSSTDGFATVVTEITIPSGNGPQGLAVYPGMENADRLYLGTREGLYEIDTSPATWTRKLIFPMPPSTDNGRRMIVHQGRLWFAQGVSTDEPAIIHTLTTHDGVRVFDSKMGLNVGDGVAAEALGTVYWMEASGPFLYAAIGGGAASRNARVWCHNGEGWHSVRRHGTANQRILWLGRGLNSYLYYSLATSSTVHDVEALQYIDTNPSSGVLIPRLTTGFIDLPDIDGGMPTISAAWLRAAVDATDLGADTTGEYIALSHGLDGAVRTTTSLGNIVSGTKVQKYASGAGAAGVSDALRVTLNRDGAVNTDSPRLRSVEMDYLKMPPTLNGYIFRIDILATALAEDENVDTIFTRINTARTAGTLPAFVYDGITSTNVRVWVDFIEELALVPGDTAVTSMADTAVKRHGYADVRVEEVI